MIIGQKGEKIKEIGTKARINIEELLGVKIHLFLLFHLFIEAQVTAVTFCLNLNLIHLYYYH